MALGLAPGTQRRAGTPAQRPARGHEQIIASGTSSRGARDTERCEVGAYCGAYAYESRLMHPFRPPEEIRRTLCSRGARTSTHDRHERVPRSGACTMPRPDPVAGIVPRRRHQCAIPGPDGVMASSAFSRCRRVADDVVGSDPLVAADSRVYGKSDACRERGCPGTTS